MLSHEGDKKGVFMEIRVVESGIFLNLWCHMADIQLVLKNDAILEGNYMNYVNCA